MENEEVNIGVRCQFGSAISANSHETNRWGWDLRLCFLKGFSDEAVHHVRILAKKFCRRGMGWAPLGHSVFYVFEPISGDP